MKTIILDTNFLTIPYRFKLDIFDQIDDLIQGEYELVTLNGVVRELNYIRKKKSEDSVAAKVGLDLIEKNNIRIIPSSRDVDNSIVSLSGPNTLVATNDKQLIKRLKSKNVKVIYLRAGKRLMVG